MLYVGMQTLTVNSEMQYCTVYVASFPGSPLAPMKKTLFFYFSSGREESLGMRLLFMLQELQSIGFIECIIRQLQLTDVIGDGIASAWNTSVIGT